MSEDSARTIADDVSDDCGMILSRVNFRPVGA
jgi:hypothetical protein